MRNIPLLLACLALFSCDAQQHHIQPKMSQANITTRSQSTVNPAQQDAQKRLDTLKSLNPPEDAKYGKSNEQYYNIPVLFRYWLDKEKRRLIIDVYAPVNDFWPVEQIMGILDNDSLIVFRSVPPDRMNCDPQGKCLFPTDSLKEAFGGIPVSKNQSHILRIVFDRTKKLNAVEGVRSLE